LSYSRWGVGKSTAVPIFVSPAESAPAGIAGGLATLWFLWEKLEFCVPVFRRIKEEGILKETTADSETNWNRHSC
jgi:hypothetical protein